MPGPSNIKECRYLVGTSMSTAFTDASSATWAAGTAEKLDLTSLDIGSLAYPDLGNPIIKESIIGIQRPVPGLRNGNFSFSSYCGAGSADTTDQDIMNFIAQCFGTAGATAPAAKTDAADSAGAHTTSRVYATAHGQSAGCAVKVGAQGDGRAEGVIRRVTAVDTDYIDVSPDLPGAPNDDDALVFSHYASLAPGLTTRYFDFLIIGDEASNGNQKQVIGAVPAISFSGFGFGEPVMANYNWVFADQQWVPTGELDQLEPTQDAENIAEFSPLARLKSQLTISDAGGYIDFQAGDYSLDLGMEWAPIPDSNGVNGIGGFALIDINPVFEATIVASSQDTPQGLEADFTAGTSKHIILSCGTLNQNSVSFIMPDCYLIDAPVQTDINGLVGYRVRYALANSSTNTFRMHWL